MGAYRPAPRSCRMRTEIPAAEDMPAMTADHMRRTILDAYKAYETSDRGLIEPLIAEEFSFTSPYDEAIDRVAYFERCWPNHQTTRRIKVERNSKCASSMFDAARDIQSAPSFTC